MLDALIVGAGPTGLTMALDLRRRGLDVRVIDRAPTPPPDASRALALQARTLELFEQFGIIDEVLARSISVAAVNVIGARSKRTRIGISAFSALETPFPQMRMLPQHDTERLLEQRFLQLGGGRIERGVALQTYQQTEEKITATLQSVGGGEVVEAKWLLGCDGSKSAVREGAGIAFDGDTYDDHCMVGDVFLNWSLPDGELYIFPSPQGLAVAFPEPGTRRYRLLCILPSQGVAQQRDLSLSEFEAALKKIIPVAFSITASHFTSRYRLHHRVATQFRRGRAFLAGDAAHVHSPVGGQGMNTGIQDAVNLAWKLALVTREQAPMWILDSYEAERRGIALHLIGATDRVFGIIAGHGFWGAALRRFAPEVAPRALGFEPLQHAFFGFFSQLKVRYRHSALMQEDMDGSENAPHAARSGPRSGERAPDAKLCDNDGSPVRLFQRFGGVLHVLALFTGESPTQLTVQQLTQLGEAVAQDFGTIIKCVVVSRAAAMPGVDADIDGEAHRRYGVQVPTAYLIRPDGYIGFRIQRPVYDTLKRQLMRRFSLHDAPTTNLP